MQRFKIILRAILKVFRFSENLTHLFFLLSRRKFTSIAIATLVNFNEEKREKEKIKIRKPKYLEYILIICILIVIIGLKVNTNEPGFTISNNKQEQTFAEQKEIETCTLHQQQLKTAISAYFEKAIKAGDVLGAAVSIVKGNSILISDGYGKRSINDKAKVNGETIFRLGSLSKGFTGILAADLKDEGKLSWNDKVTDYIPEFQLGDSANTAKIKVSHILSHTSGAPYHSYTNLVEAGLPISKIATRFNEVKPISEPGTMYSYQNAIFALSEEVMHKVTGKEIHTLLNNRFFKPLCMYSISMNHKMLTASKNVAMPHSRSRNGWRILNLKNRYYNAVSAGGINASSLDMAKWMRFLLGYNPELMKKYAIQEAFKPLITFKNNYKYYQRWPGHLKSSYGFGWRIHQFRDKDTGKEFTIWHHGGSVNSYRNEIAIYPEADLGICVLINSNSKLARTVIPDLHRIIKIIYDEEAQVNINSSCVLKV